MIDPRDEMPQSIAIRFSVPIQLRDGANLNANLYFPTSDYVGPWIATLTPYTADFFHNKGIAFAGRGLGFASIDVRGRGNSGGIFKPYINESNDGYDAIEWLASQSFCNGSVGMWGGSYGGYVQWTIARELPPHLRTIVPTAASFPGVDVPMRKNIFYPYMAQWLAFVGGKSLNTNLFNDEKYWVNRFTHLQRNRRPFADLLEDGDHQRDTFSEWCSHPSQDEYWDALTPTPAEYQDISIPVLTITGSFDDDQPGALEYFSRHTRARTPSRSNHYLVIGPWDHAGTRNPELNFGGVNLGPASLLDLDELHFKWYEWVFGIGPKPEFLSDSVRYYVIGANLWRSCSGLAGPMGKQVQLFLASDGIASNLASCGRLVTTACEGGPDRYTYAPGLERLIDVEAAIPKDSLVDDSLTIALGTQQFVYESEDFEEDTEISGFFDLTAWLAIDAVDTDFHAAVWEIERDGSCIRLTTDAIRAQYRSSLRVAQAVVPGEVLAYHFDHFTWISKVVPAGHRLRLTIAPIGRLAEAPFCEVNYNIGGNVCRQDGELAQTVTATLFHDARYPSVLVVPVGIA